MELPLRKSYLMFKKLKDKTREAAEAAQKAAEATLTRSDSMSSLNSQNSAFSGKLNCRLI